MKSANNSFDKHRDLPVRKTISAIIWRCKAIGGATLAACTDAVPPIGAVICDTVLSRRFASSAMSSSKLKAPFVRSLDLVQNRFLSSVAYPFLRVDMECPHRVVQFEC
jgi:hypothetical protein